MPNSFLHLPLPPPRTPSPPRTLLPALDAHGDFAATTTGAMARRCAGESLALELTGVSALEVGDNARLLKEEQGEEREARGAEPTL